MSIITQALTQELNDSISASVEYRNAIQGAKTNTKRTFLQKKLVKNNIKVAELITALDRLSNDKAELDHASGIPEAENLPS